MANQDEVALSERIEIEIDRIDSVVESLEVMSRYLGIANGAIAFALASFVGSLISGQTILDSAVRWLSVTSLATGLASAFFGLLSVQAFTTARRELSLSRQLYSANRIEAANKIFDGLSLRTRRRRMSWTFYAACALTAVSSTSALNVFVKVVMS